MVVRAEYEVCSFLLLFPLGGARGGGGRGEEKPLSSPGKLPELTKLFFGRTEREGWEMGGDGSRNWEEEETPRIGLRGSKRVRNRYHGVKNNICGNRKGKTSVPPSVTIHCTIYTVCRGEFAHRICGTLALHINIRGEEEVGLIPKFISALFAFGSTYARAVWRSTFSSRGTSRTKISFVILWNKNVPEKKDLKLHMGRFRSNITVEFFRFMCGTTV